MFSTHESYQTPRSLPSGWTVRVGGKDGATCPFCGGVLASGRLCGDCRDVFRGMRVVPAPWGVPDGAA